MTSKAAQSASDGVVSGSLGPQRPALLFRDASDNERGGVDNGKALGIVTALEIKRLVFGGVDMRHVPWA
jgi:hypothetical protein